MTKFKRITADWTTFRKLDPAPVEINYHAERGEHDGLSYDDRMAGVYTGALQILKKAQEQGDKWIMFIHGNSTSRPGKKTSRSQIRALMRSSEATPYIIRKECIQHWTVFVAAVREKEL